MTRKQQKQSRESTCPACKSCGPKNSPCIVCSPFQKRDRYYSDSSDSSCPDFSDLCRDESRKCKKDKSSKSSKESSSSDSSCSKESSSLYSSNSSSSSDASACGSCRQGCGACSRTTACACRSCSDYSASDVLRAFESDYSGCVDYSALANDQSRKCPKPLEPKPITPPPKKPVKGKKFVVKFAPKAGHPWAVYNPGADSIHVNGKNGPVLHLQQGSTYYFCVEQEVPPGAEAPHLFILTTSPMGGPGSEIIPGGFNPVVNGSVCLKVDKSTPRYFFYQDTRDICAGGLVVVHANV